jgi:hypothetical protein
MEKIIGRKEEIKLLESLKGTQKSAFVAVYGRRRVGKTYLVRNVFAGQFSFQITALGNVNLRAQIANFQAAVARQLPQLPQKTSVKNWFEAFLLLADCLERDTRPKKIIFLDELPWFDYPQSGFVSALEHFWNSWASARQDIVLIVCGSAASWMVNNLINNHGGLHNRITHRLRLQPFSLTECEAFFQHKSIYFDRYQLIQLYMVMGGIPFYLEQVEGGSSAAQNIDRLCFKEDGVLRKEFENLYPALFKKSEKHLAFIEALAQKNRGLTRNELLNAVKLPDGGAVTRILRDLEESQFIRRYTAFGTRKYNAIYQLCDFYSLFYLRFIKESSPDDDNFWTNSLDDPAIRAWSGLAFEQVCFAHIAFIKKALSIGGIQTQTSAWIGEGAQVDLIIDRRDHVINLFEIKFSINHFQIDKEYAEKLRQKVALFKTQSGTNKTIFLTLLTSHGLVQNEYAGSVVQKALTMNDLFD